MKKILSIICALVFIGCSKEHNFQNYVKDRVWFRTINGKRIIYLDSKGKTFSWRGIKGVKPTLKNILTPKTSIGTNMAKGWRYDFKYVFKNDTLYLKSALNDHTKKFKLGEMSDTISDNINYLKFTILAKKNNNKTEEIRFYSKKY